MARVLLIGKSGRVHCLATALVKSACLKELYALSDVENPGLLNLKKSKKIVDVVIGKTDDIGFVREQARIIKPDFVVIGPEEPLAAGVVDMMLTKQLGIPCVGPTKSLARLESSKSFTRELLSKYS